MTTSIGEWIIVGLLMAIGGGVAALLKRVFFPRRSNVYVKMTRGDVDHVETEGDRMVFDLEVTAFNDEDKGAKIEDIVFRQLQCGLAVFDEFSRQIAQWHREQD